MVTINLHAPEEEQQICVLCGFCCDSTLFSHAGLNPGERGHLPEKIEENSYSEGDKDYFRQPCPYFSGRCTIYDGKRAYVCGSYRCQLLHDFAKEKTTFTDALETVREAVKMRAAVMELYEKISGKSEKINFIQLLHELGKILESGTDKGPLTADYEILLAQCNIFEALLIRHFRSSEDFEKMIMK